MQSPAPAARPPGTLWSQLTAALGAPGVTAAELADEAARRVQARAVPGRVDARGRIVQYPSPLEAAVDHRLWMLEQERRDAESRHAAALDDVDGAFGPREAADAAKVVLDTLKRREYVAATLAPLGRRIALDEALDEAERELADLVPDAPRMQVLPEEIPVPAGRSQHPLREPDGYDFARKAAIREAMRQNALTAGPTRYSTALQVVVGVSIRIEKWEADHPRLAVLLKAERQQQAAAASPQP